MRAMNEHVVTRVERGASTSHFMVSCACGWISDPGPRSVLCTHYTRHLALDRADIEIALAVRFAVSAALAAAVAPSSESLFDEYCLPLDLDEIRLRLELDEQHALLRG